MAPEIDREEIRRGVPYRHAEVVAREFISVKIDAEKGEGPELTQIYGVTGFPTVVFTSEF